MLEQTVTIETRRKTAARRAAIISAAQLGEVSTAELSRRFGVTDSTIRRDLRELASQGAISRTFGGMTLLGQPAELNVPAKARLHPVEKRAIGLAAAAHVDTGDTVILDAGTTVGRLAVALRYADDLTVITGSMNALLALHDAPGVEIIVIGGWLRHTNQGTLGSIAESMLSGMTADKVFLGAEGVHPLRGLSCPTPEQAALKTLMIANSARVFVLADASKLGVASFHHWAPLPPNVTLITDDVPAGFAAEFQCAAGRVIEIAEHVTEDDVDEAS